jgi:hypothetical protein
MTDNENRPENASLTGPELHQPPRSLHRPPLTKAQIDGAVAAAWHLLAHGLPPIFDEETFNAVVARLRDAA